VTELADRLMIVLGEGEKILGSDVLRERNGGREECREQISLQNIKLREFQFLRLFGASLTINFLQSSLKYPPFTDDESIGMGPPAGLATTTSYPALLNW
jgi:hypothetical protein